MGESRGLDFMNVISIISVPFSGHVPMRDVSRVYMIDEPTSPLNVSRKHLNRL